ncbi:hypothetical protein Patl1_26196 [Pistacia atlantica]|uniref:Uncharacterized protein n=1 Tax=Pistacia atlantica TaxID=434234 RepID=A0ACC1B0Q8_9ROSI|nr:hypothetical protein Patl1_26196 [Pistacia atlantica]
MKMLNFVVDIFIKIDSSIAIFCVGVATAFASRDIIGNVLSGLSMQFSKPFSLGDAIKAGIEGQVTEMGLTTTKLLNAEKFPVLLPNLTFYSQIESSFTELTLGCILKTMSKDELYTTEQDIRL